MSKHDELAAALKDGWIPITTLMTVLNWKRTSVRGALSDLSRKRGLKIERQRIDGVTSYRIAPDADVLPVASATNVQPTQAP